VTLREILFAIAGLLAIGWAVRLKFIGHGTAACSQEVVLPDLARRVRVHEGELAMLDFTPERTGEYEFTSGGVRRGF
jgi:plastocyanin domain-containing protein